MKLSYRLIGLLTISLMGGCASKVITYDVDGNTIGSCSSKRAFFSVATAHCYGYSNTNSLQFSAPQTILIPRQNTVVRPDLVHTEMRNQLPDIKPTHRIHVTHEPVPLPLIPPYQHIKIFNETPFLR